MINSMDRSTNVLCNSEIAGIIILLIEVFRSFLPSTFLVEIGFIEALFNVVKALAGETTRMDTAEKS